jgi:phosphopantothenoylcysteine decarboxylase/phosphopantothenate--cysteine ligase
MDKLVLGVCSSISLYKSCEIIRGFQKKGLQVQVIMTQNATQMISPLLFSALAGKRTIVNPFQEESSEEISHIELAKEISLFLIAPATANIIGKLASGVADDFLSTFYLAVRCPVLIAPAMNEAMYLHEQTQENIRILKSRGVQFIEPERGYLACQDEGWGRLASPEEIIEEALRSVRKSQSLKGRTLLVTAGPTREFLDPVRFLSNRSTGKMGFALAEEASKRGADVILISGPTHLIPPQGVQLKRIQDALEMEKEVLENFKQADVVIMSAAVSDLTFPAKADQKIKKKVLQERFDPVKTPDILKKLGEMKNRKILVGFAAETENLIKNAEKKMRGKNVDLLVANDVLQEGIGFGSDYNKVQLIFPDGKMIKTDKKSKREISRVILDEIEAILGQKS